LRNEDLSKPHVAGCSNVEGAGQLTDRMVDRPGCLPTPLQLNCCSMFSYLQLKSVILLVLVYLIFVFKDLTNFECLIVVLILFTFLFIITTMIYNFICLIILIMFLCVWNPVFGTNDTNNDVYLRKPGDYFCNSKLPAGPINCPVGLFYDEISFSGQICSYNMCNIAVRKEVLLVMYSSKVLAQINDFTLSIIKPDKMSEDCYKLDMISSNISMVTLIKASVGFCAESTISISADNKLKVNATEARLCCSSFCQSFLNNETLSGFISYCTRLQATMEIDGKMHTVNVFNMNPQSCKSIDCFFCKEFLFRAACDDIYMSIFWILISSIGGILVGILIWIKYRLFVLIKNTLKYRNRQRVNQEDEEEAEVEEVIRLRPTTLRQGFFTTTISLLAILTMVNACSDTVLLSGVESLTVGTMSIGKSLCFKDKESHIWKLTLKEVEVHYHPTLEYYTNYGPLTMGEESTKFKYASSWFSAGWNLQGKRSSDQISITCCEQMPFSFMCRSLFTKSIFAVYSLENPMATLKFEKEDSNGKKTSHIVSEARVFEDDWMKFEVLGHSAILVKYHLITMEGKHFLVDSGLVSTKGAPVYNKIGGIQCEKEKDKKVNGNWLCMADLPPLKEICPKSLLTVAFHDLPDEAINSFDNINKLNPPPVNSEDGTWVDELDSVKYQIHSHSTFQMSLLLKQWEEIQVMEENCFIQEISQFGLKKQNSGAMLKIRTNSTSGYLKLFHEHHTLTCYISENTCTINLTLMDDISDIKYECGSYRSVTRVLGTLEEGASIEKLSQFTPYFNNGLLENPFRFAFEGFNFSKWSNYIVMFICCLITLKVIFRI